MTGATQRAEEFIKGVHLQRCLSLGMSHPEWAGRAHGHAEVTAAKALPHPPPLLPPGKHTRKRAVSDLIQSSPFGTKQAISDAYTKSLYFLYITHDLTCACIAERQYREEPPSPPPAAAGNSSACRARTYPQPVEAIIDLYYLKHATTFSSNITNVLFSNFIIKFANTCFLSRIL